MDKKEDDYGSSKFNAECNISINVPLSNIDALIRLLQAVNGENNSNTANFTISPKCKNGEITKRCITKNQPSSRPLPATELFDDLPVPTLEKVLSILRSRYDSGIIKGQQFRSGDAKAFVLKQSGLGRSTFAVALHYGIEKQKIRKISHGIYQFVSESMDNSDTLSPSVPKEQPMTATADHLLDIMIDGNSEDLSLFFSILKAVSKTTQRINLYFGGGDNGISARFKNGSNPYSMVEFTMPKEAFNIFSIQNNQNVKLGFFLSDLMGHLSAAASAASFRITLPDRSSDFFRFNEFQFKVMECEASESQFQTQKAIMPLIKPEAIVTLPRSIFEDILKNAKGVSDNVKISCLPGKITFEAIGEYSKFEKEINGGGCSSYSHYGPALALSFDIDAMLSLLLHSNGGNIRLEFAKDVLVVHHILDSRFTLSNYIIPVAQEQQEAKTGQQQLKGDEGQAEKEMVPELAM